MSEKVLIYDQAKGLNLDPNAVDEEAGIIRGVSIATAGVQAIGHEMEVLDGDENVIETREWWTDGETLQSMLEVIQSIGQPLKAKMEHGSGLAEIVGEFDNFRIEGDHLRADFQRYETSQYATHLMTLAKRISKQFGISVTATLHRLKSGAIDFMRAVNVDSADFVDNPAINAGLFSKSIDKTQNFNQAQDKGLINEPPKTPDMTKEEMTEIVETAIAEKLSAVTDTLAAYEDRMKALESPKEEEENLEEEEKADEMGEKIAEMSAKLDSVTSKLTELSALGIKRGAKPGDGDVKPEDVNDFDTALAAKVAQGKSRLIAFGELSRENPQMVALAAKKKGVSVWKLSTEL